MIEKIIVTKRCLCHTLIMFSESNPAGPGNFLEAHFGVIDFTFVTVVFR